MPASAARKRWEGRPATASEPNSPEPVAVAATMASAVERIRRMAATVFRGDAALFADGNEQATP